jgi:hypothetical protein
MDCIRRVYIAPALCATTADLRAVVTPLPERDIHGVAAGAAAEIGYAGTLVPHRRGPIDRAGVSLPALPDRNQLDLVDTRLKAPVERSTWILRREDAGSEME